MVIGATSYGSLPPKRRALNTGFTLGRAREEARFIQWTQWFSGGQRRRARLKVGAAGGKCTAIERFSRQHHGELSSFSTGFQFKATSQVLHSFSNSSQPDPRPATGALKLGERRRWIPLPLSRIMNTVPWG